MKYNTIHSLGSRCQNSDVLKYYKYREFSGFFDFMNTSNVKNIKHILADDFHEILKPENNFTLKCDQMTIDPETGDKLPTSNRTSNKFYDIDHTDVHNAIFPHHDLNNVNDYNHFVRCKNRFKKLKQYNTLFNYTYNKWENHITTEDMEEIVNILKTVHKFTNFKICYIGVSFGDSLYKKTIAGKYFDNWDICIGKNSFTGGLFSNHVDNENYINIIKSYDISDNRVTREEIDN